jgi:hypothetical protein
MLLRHKDWRGTYDGSRYDWIHGIDRLGGVKPDTNTYTTGDTNGGAVSGKAHGASNSTLILDSIIHEI